LDKSQTTTNFGWKNKSTKYTFMLWLVIHVLSLATRMQFFGEQWEQVMCFHVYQLLIIKNILLLFWNNSRHLFLCLDGLDCDMWCNREFPCGILIEFVQIEFKSTFRYVGWIMYLPTYIPTYPFRLNTYLDKTYLRT